MKRIVWIVLAGAAAFAQTPPSVDEIMARVATNQAKSVEVRKQFVYKQEQLIALRFTNGKTACQEKREYTVVPNSTEVTRKLVKSESIIGHCDDDSNKNVTANIDDSTAEAMGSPVAWEKDGVPRDLFPLTAKEQIHYEYRLAGIETYRGRQAYRIAFQPKRPRETVDAGVWKGEALIDAEEFEPISVTTALTEKVPLGVRVLLGTDVRGLGFSVNYERVADGVWFPTGFGGEFKFNVLFFYRRSVSINVKNSDFKRTDVNSNVAFDKVQ
ncbi:MAG: hypothetical protein WBY44_16870 [Bryobacteraceae bacterium]